MQIPLAHSLTVLAGLALAACSEPPPPPPVGPPPAPGEIRIGSTPAGDATTQWLTGTVTGCVFADGPSAPTRALDVADAPEWAAALRAAPPADPSIVRNEDQSVPHTFVYAERGPHRSLLWQIDPAYQPRLEVSNCLLSPRVFGLMSGEALRILNHDPDDHGLVFRGERTGRLVVTAPAQGRIEQAFRTDDVAIAITHTELEFTTGWMFVLEHPFFCTTEEDGTFEIRDLPPGDYTFVAWHELFGRAEFDVAVDVDQTTEVSVRLPGFGVATLPPR